MRIRTIKPEFWSHPVLGLLSDQTKLLAIGLLNLADDEGYFLADARLVRAALRPFDDDSTMIRRSIDELSRIGYIDVREHPTHGPIGHIVAFLKHQRIDRPKPSTIKELHNSTTNRRSIVDQSLLEWKGMEGNIEPNKDSKPTGEIKPKAVPKERRERERNPLFDALAAVSGENPSANGGQIAKAVKDIKAMSPDVTPEQIHKRAENYRSHFKEAALSSSALAKWWGKCESPQNRIQASNGEKRILCQ